MFDFNLNNKAASSVGVYAVRRPNIPTPQLRYESVKVPGVDGAFIQSENAYDPIQFEIECNFKSSSPETFNDEARTVRNWLFSQQSGRLSFSDDPDWCYLTKVIQPSNIERTSRTIGVFSITVICDPYLYRVDGMNEITLPSSYTNTYMTAHPVYKFTGSGTYQIDIGSHFVLYDFSITVTNSATIDTELMLVYADDGKDVISTVTRGNLSDLWLPYGSSIRIYTSIPSGGKITIIPRWRTI